MKLITLWNFGVSCLSVASLSLVSVLSQAIELNADELTVPAGETFTVTPQNARMFLKRLNLGDKSRIEFEPGVTDWEVRAEIANIGSNVVIGAQGAAGKAAESINTEALPQADVCQNGADGQVGGAGENGLAGVNIILELGLSKIGDLVIDARGGQGGQGSQGQDGQSAGKLSRCNAKDGGAGGYGGDGGQGGNGGDVTISYWDPKNGQSLARVKQRIQVITSGGQGGKGGLGGQGGVGSEAQYIKKRTLTGNRSWVDAGLTGAEGDPGELGRDGTAGKSLIGPNLDQRLSVLMQKNLTTPEAASDLTRQKAVTGEIPAVPAVEALPSKKVTSTLPSMDDQGSGLSSHEIQDLKQSVLKMQEQIKSLQKRIETLEKR